MRGAAAGVLMAAVLSAAPGLQAQVAPTPGPGVGVWLTTGLGAGFQDGSYDQLAFAAQLTTQWRSHVMAVRAGYIDALTSGPTTRSVELLYGRAKTGRWGRVSLQAGVSRVYLCGSSGTGDGCSVFGLPLVAEGALRGEIVGLGLQVAGNLNRERSFATVMIVVQIGRMR